MLILSLVLLLLSTSITSRQDKSILYSRTAITILVVGTVITEDNLFLLFLNKGIGIFGGLFHSTSTTNVFHIVILAISSVILLLTSFYPRKVWLREYSSIDRLLFTKLIYYQTVLINKTGEQFKILEYSLIILFIVIGGVFLISTSDLVSVFLSIELQSYGLYLISTIYRDSEPATAGGLMYFLLGGLSSCFILLSTSLLYANAGTTNLDSLYIINSISNADDHSLNSLLYWYKSYYIHLSLLIMSVGFLFKVSAAPFHFWSPDVYDAIPTVVTTFVAIVAKISIFVFLLELVHYTSKSMLDTDFSWVMSLLFSSLLSLIIGTVVGLTQSRIKRLLAFSTISHVGFILLGLSIHSVESTQAFIFYLIQYSVSNLNAFIILLAIGYSLYSYVYKEEGLNNTDANKKDAEKNENLIDANNSPIQLIDQLKGYYYINPVLAMSLAITLFSFAGIPPLIGFFGKQMILSAAIDNGYIFMALVAILTSVISAVYYLSIIKQIFFDKPDNTLNTELNDFKAEATISEKNIIVKKVSISINNIVVSSSLSLSISIITIVITLFMFIPEELLNIANILALILFNI
uniref:NADH dehydrogenase subunit 2 n=1 Tax=Periconia digitata TaxID=1303443 RepID=UPI0023AA384D|nr:NADH dehydrogenase subunit 2 [Periconia digitata]WCA44874.1 NADH dehydrogenase subunit 2 [Periconia digitata]